MHFLILIGLCLNAAPVEPMTASAVVDLAQTFSSFISDYGALAQKDAKKAPVLEAMRSQLATFRVAAILPKISQYPELGVCGGHITRGAALRSLGSPAAAALRLHRVSRTHQDEMLKLLKKTNKAIRANEAEYFRCMESKYILPGQQASLQSELGILKRITEQLFAD